MEWQRNKDFSVIGFRASLSWAQQVICTNHIPSHPFTKCVAQSLDPTWHLVATDIGIDQAVVFERALRDSRHVTSLTLGTRQRCTQLASCALRTSHENARRLSVPIGRFKLLPESRHQFRSVSRWPIVKSLGSEG